MRTMRPSPSSSGTPRWRRCSAIGLSREDEARAEVLAAEGLDDGPDRPLEHVVGEHDDAGIAVDEALGEAERLRDAARLLLVAVEELVDAVLVAVAEQAEELAGVRAAGDEHQLVDARLHERLDGVRDHRPVVDRQQVLVRDPGERMEARARAAREDDALHAEDRNAAVDRRLPDDSCGHRAAHNRARRRLDFRSPDAVRAANRDRMAARDAERAPQADRGVARLRRHLGLHRAHRATFEEGQGRRRGDERLARRGASPSCWRSPTPKVPA